MSTHDYIVDNQNGANFRSDLNNALAAIVSNNSSATAPSTTYAFMMWADTANDLLKQRNAADSAWVDILTLSTGAVSNAEVADNAITLAKMAHGTDGEIITYDSSGAPATVGVGSSGQVLTSNGAGSAPTMQDSAGGGKVLQVVNFAGATETETTSGTYTDTTLTATITPTLSTSKILVLVSQNGISKAAGNGGVYGQLLRGSTVLAVLGLNVAYTNTADQNRIGSGWSSNYLDSPSTTSATTYKTQFKAYNGVTAAVQASNAKSTITLMEIGA